MAMYTQQPQLVLAAHGAVVNAKGEGYPKTCTCSCGCSSAAEGDSGKCKYCKEEKCKKKDKK
ncbi:hypothetical protein PFICI_14763 [Pestalotiopsis fici W106-1]|uniref:Metallothionein n=1 Tax=Pestalotiopsis fici (strain W106-1 / CGMCC3.15140) TaxID=1229662 RepID=W3WKZ6_PESFW|nr:uncharacterized protein PFICI_14763 [Pestalotiopsis fici W106-1]ETS73817.1 hypothetical protein PFICI_14763 [Pestalotiopsis fici W106-1]